MFLLVTRFIVNANWTWAINRTICWNNNIYNIVLTKIGATRAMARSVAYSLFMSDIPTTSPPS